MNINNIQKNDNFYFVSEDNTTKDAAYYSLLIGIEAYLKTYHSVAMNLRSYRGEEKWINHAMQENDKYIECYLI